MANITVTLYWDMDLRKWTTTLGGTTETDPIQGLVQGDIVKFAVRFVQTGVAVVLAAPVFTASGIKADNDFTGSYLIQLSAPVLSDTTLYTFTVNPLNSAQLNTFLQTYRNTWCALEIYDSVNGILTTPLELQIMPGYSLSGTPTDNVAGVIVVVAGKTVTFPQSLTFPSALGTNGFQLTTNGAGALTWAAGTNAPGGSTTQVQYNNAGSFAGITGATTNGTALTLVAPVLGAATATSINGIPIFGDVGALGFYMTNAAGGIDTSDGGGSITTGQAGGPINTSGGGGAIDTAGNGSIELGIAANRITLVGTTASNGKTATLPNVTGTVAVATPSGTINLALFTTSTSGAPAYRGIASADIATALLTPGPIGTTPNTGAFTTLSATGVASVTDTTNATSTTAASLKTAGGLGVVKDAWFGASMRFATNGAGGAGNIFLGTTTSRAGNGATTTGTQNVCIGSSAGANLTTGGSNVCLGDQAGGGLTSSSNYNMCIGYVALGNATSGSDYNVAIGASSLFLVTNGDNNVGIGRNSGDAITTGGNNTFIGFNSDGVATLSNQTAIGTGATCTAANQVMLGTATEIVTLPGGLVTEPVAQTASTAAVSVSVTTTALTTTGVAQAITLANGTNGQIKIITHIANGGTGTAVLTPATSAADYNTITFSSVGDTATLQYHTTGGWYILSLRGAVAA